MEKRVTVKHVGQNQYDFFDGETKICGVICSSYDYVQNDVKKLELALSQVPDGMKYFWQHDPLLKEYAGKLLGGWLCDSKVKVFGIYNDGFSGYAACLFWELSIENILPMMDYVKDCVNEY